MLAEVSLFLSLISALPPALVSLQKEMGSTKSFTVSFKQTVKQDLFPDVVDSAQGRLMFTRPNKMNWTYETPKKRTIDFDGSELVINDGGQKQTIRDSGRITLEKSFGFLWGQPDATLFKIESQSATTFLVKPKHADVVTFVSILVTVERGRVSEALVTDKVGGKSRLEFSNWKLNR